MPILVKHSGNATPTAYGAFGAGQGKRYSQDSTAAMQDIQERERQARELAFRANEAEKDRQAAAAGAAAAAAAAAAATKQDQDWRSGEAAAGREFQAGQEGAARQAATEGQYRQFDLQQEGADAAQLRGQKDLEFSYSAKQRAQFNQLSEALENASTSGDFAPDEIPDVRREILARQAGIQPLPRLKKKSPYPEGQDVGQSWPTDDGRFLLTRNAKGDVRKLAETNSEPTWRDRIEAQKLFTEQFKNPDTDAVDYDAVKGAMAKLFSGGAVDSSQEPPSSSDIEQFTGMKTVFSSKPPTTGKKVSDEELADKVKAMTARDINITDMTSLDEKHTALESGTVYVAPDGQLRRKL